MSIAASTVTRIVLVRHGHVEGIEPPRFRGRADLPLTFHGFQQAERARDLLGCALRPSVAYASPLARCITTAEVIVQPEPVRLTPMPSFVDMDYGDWQGRTYEEVQQSDPERFAQWFQAPHLAVIPGGETLPGVAARVAETMRTIAARHRGETVLLVGHDSVNRVLLLLALDLPLSRYWHLRQDPCAMNLVTRDDVRGWNVASMNETGHLHRLR
jgi:phosphoserine phosphatase